MKKAEIILNAIESGKIDKCIVSNYQFQSWKLKPRLAFQSVQKLDVVKIDNSKLYCTFSDGDETFECIIGFEQARRNLEKWEQSKIKNTDFLNAIRRAIDCNAKTFMFNNKMYLTDIAKRHLN